MKKLCLVLLAVFLLGSVSALAIKDEAITNVIVPEFNQPAQFKLTITGAEQGSYNIYTLTDIRLMPSSNFQLKAGTNKKEVYVYPTDELKIRGFYTFTYTLKTTNASFGDKLTVKIVDLKDAFVVFNVYVNV